MGLSTNEKRAIELGMTVKEYKQTDEYKNKKQNESSSSSSKKFEEAMKDKGVWNAFNKLSDDQKEFIEYNYSITTSDSKEKVKLLEEALEEATKQADPYWSSFLKIAQDEVVRAVDDIRNTFQYQKTELEEKIKNISEDLTKNKDFYSLEQQSDLAKLKQSYEQQRDGVIENAANEGLTFSTKREVPLQQLEAYNENVVESTNRQYEKKIGDITVEAERGIEQSERELTQRAEDLDANLTDIGRQAEKQLGTENLPTLEGYTAIGDISGEFYENKVADIESRKQAIFDEKAQTSLQF